MTAGAWNGDLLDVLDGLAVPERQVLAWLQPTRPELFRPENFPVFNLLVDEGRFYGFPVFGVPGFKFGKYHHLDETGRPRRDRPRAPRPRRAAAAGASPSATSPTAAGRRWTCRPACSPTRPTTTSSSTCTPTTRRSRIASPCSGHGFKFASVVGEIMADLAEKGFTRHDISLFRLDRLTATRWPPGRDNRSPAGNRRSRPTAVLAPSQGWGT